MSIKPGDFSLTFLGSDATWAGERRPGLPVLRWPDGTLCQPVIMFFGYSAEIKRVKISSMKSEAFAIRAWLVFLMNNKKRWDQGSDLLLSKWRESHRQLAEEYKIEWRQVERKIHCVFTFYFHLPQAFPIDESGRFRKNIVGSHLTRGVSYPISSKSVISPTSKHGVMWSGSERFGKGRPRRPTPDEVGVDKVLRFLRSSPNREFGRGFGCQWENLEVLQADRNWLIGRSMEDGGLRAQEAAQLPLESLVRALHSDGIVLPSCQLKKTPGFVHPLDRLALDASAQLVLLSEIDALSAKGHRYLFVEVNGKGRGGGKTRSAPFSIDLIRDLLVVGVWSVRREQIQKWVSCDVQYHPPSTVFLSFKTKRSLLASSISDVLGDAFRAVSVAGSGHRLRAHYATKLAAMLWEQCFALNGYRFDQTVVNLAMDRLAEALGHSEVITSVRHYIDMEVLRHYGVKDKNKLNMLKMIWETVVKHQKCISERDALLIVSTVNHLAATVSTSDLRQILQMALDDETQSFHPTFGDTGEAINERKAPVLKLVE